MTYSLLAPLYFLSLGTDVDAISLCLVPNAGLTTSSPEDRVASDVAVVWSGVERKAKVRNAGDRLFSSIQGWC